VFMMFMCSWLLIRDTCGTMFDHVWSCFGSERLFIDVYRLSFIVHTFPF